ncbi:MAG: polymer-forming cytoskeletal protein [Bacteroidota bacterium]
MADAGIRPGQDITIIGRGMQIEGTLKVKGDVRIGGKIVGQVKVDGRVITTPEGVVEGEIESSTAEIANKVAGDVTVRDHLILRSTAVVQGDVNAPRLTVEDGAKISGRMQVGMNNQGKGSSSKMVGALANGKR